MPSKKTLDYDSYDEDDDELDDFKGLKIKADVEKHTFDLGNGTRKQACLSSYNLPLLL
jgi:hypothetical protein